MLTFSLSPKKFAQAFKMEEVRYYFGIIGIVILIITCNIYHIFGSAAKAFQQAAFQVGPLSQQPDMQQQILIPGRKFRGQSWYC